MRISMNRNSALSWRPEILGCLHGNPNDFEDLSNQGGLADLTEYYEKYRCDDLDNIFQL